VCNCWEQALGLKTVLPPVEGKTKEMQLVRNAEKSVLWVTGWVGGMQIQRGVCVFVMLREWNTKLILK